MASQSIGIPIIDTHVHVWDYAAPWMKWLEDRPSNWDVVRRDFTWRDLSRELDASGVAELILVQACTDPRETHELLRLAAKHARIRGVVGWVTLNSPKETEAQLSSFEEVGSSKLVGIRNNHRWTPDGDLLATSRALDSCRLLAERHLPLDVHVPDFRDLSVVARLAQQAPEGVYVVDHLGKPALGAPETFAAWAESMSLLGTFPNVFVKFSGWATFVGRTQAADVQPYIDLVLERFGPERVMFGSNWPVALVAGSYASTFRASLETLERLSRSDLEQVLRGSAERCYLASPRDGGGPAVNVAASSAQWISQ